MQFTEPGGAVQAQRQARAEDLARKGYRPLQHVEVASGVLPWRVDGEHVPIAWTAPSAGSGLPVVLYLPGLGEPAEAAGAAWRRAWAQAGYAVVLVQPLEDDATAWS